MLIIRQQQMEAFRPVLERHFIKRLAVRAERKFPAIASAIGRVALEQRAENVYQRARRYKLDAKRDIARFMELDFRLGPMFEDAPGMEWARKILETSGLSGASKLFRIDNRLEAAAAVNAQSTEEDNVHAEQ